MKAEITTHAGKGSQKILPSKSAVNKLVRERSSITKYAKAGPDVVQASRSVSGRKP